MHEERSVNGQRRTHAFHSSHECRQIRTYVARGSMITAKREAMRVLAVVRSAEESGYVLADRFLGKQAEVPLRASKGRVGRDAVRTARPRLGARVTGREGAGDDCAPASVRRVST
jgi:hypothetical protein